MTKLKTPSNVGAVKFCPNVSDINVGIIVGGLAGDTKCGSPADERTLKY